MLYGVAHAVLSLQCPANLDNYYTGVYHHIQFINSVLVTKLQSRNICCLNKNLIMYLLIFCTFDRIKIPSIAIIDFTQTNPGLVMESVILNWTMNFIASMVVIVNSSLMMAMIPRWKSFKTECNYCFIFFI